jgi:hypothetical protein
MAQRVTRADAAQAGRLSFTARVFGVPCDPSDHIGMNTRRRDEAIDFIVEECNAGRGSIDPPRRGFWDSFFS